MGRKIENKRVISNDRVRKERKQKNKIIIAVEGKNKTEKLYFNNFDNGKKNYSISFAKGNYTDPLNLVKMLIEEMKKIGVDLSDGDRAYCIFDTDIEPIKNTVIKEAKKLEKHQLENGKIIGTVEANPSTEIYKIVEELLK